MDMFNAKEKFDRWFKDADEEARYYGLHTLKGWQDGKKSKNCPYKEIVELYHQLLPELQKVIKLTSARRVHVKARWMTDLKSMDKWRNYFMHVAKSDFLMGRSSGSRDRRPFKADFDWLIKEGNLVKIAEGKYHV